MTKVKICGITNLADASAAVEAGADLLGFNFYPPSPRSISPEKCVEITSSITSKFPATCLIGVFVNMPVEQIKFIMDTCSLDYAQLHGDETPETLESLQGKAYKAFRGIPHSKILNQFTLKGIGNTPAFLIDASVQGLYGGSGVTADWQSAAQLARKYPGNPGTCTGMLLAGGLNPENVAAAVEKVKPWGVDTASGVESAPGRKDAQKMKAFIEAVRAASS